MTSHKTQTEAQFTAHYEKKNQAQTVTWLGHFKDINRDTGGGQGRVTLREVGSFPR